MSYYNTTHLSGGDLKEAEETNKALEKTISEIFMFRPHVTFSPSQMWKLITEFGNEKELLTNVRRAFSDLTKKGILVKTQYKVPGLYKRPEHIWRLRTKAEQQKLFV